MPAQGETKVSTLTSFAEGSPRFTARAGGFFWLMTILTGVFAMIAGRGFVVSGDAAATAANILAGERMFRIGALSNLIATACYLAATVLVYAILRPVNRNISLLAAFFSLVGCAMGAVSSFLQLAPLSVLGGAQSLSGLTMQQSDSLAFAFIRLGRLASVVSFMFFGLHCLLVGSLILRSTFMSRIVGALMAFGGAGWLTFSLANLLAPAAARNLFYLMLPGILGETALTLWLLVMGVNVQRWKEQAIASGQRQP